MDNSGNTDYDDGGNGGSIDAIGISLGILSLLAVLCVGSYFCYRSRRSRAQQQPASAAFYGWNHLPSAKATYPKVPYSEVKKKLAGSTTTSSCSICLGDYDDADMLRLLPQCGHVFHLDCIDPWLLLHPTCPVCRSSPAAPSSPIVLTPVAGVATLAVADVSPV